MPGPAPVKLGTFSPGGQTITPPAPGTNGWHPLAAIAEPISVGLPPHRPDLVARGSFGTPARVLESAAGYTHAAPLDVAGRPRYAVTWTGRTKAVRDALVNWFASTERLGTFAFDLEADGPGTAPITVRPVGPPTYRWGSKSGHDVEVECEEVF